MNVLNAGYASYAQFYELHAPVVYGIILNHVENSEIAGLTLKAVFVELNKQEKDFSSRLELLKITFRQIAIAVPGLDKTTLLTRYFHATKGERRTREKREILAKFDRTRL